VGTAPPLHLHAASPDALSALGATSATADSSAPATTAGSPETGTGAASGFLAGNGSLLAALSRPQATGDGTYSLTANLHPPELGHVQAVVSVQGDEVQVALSAGSAAGHDALSANLDQLRQQLADGGANVVVTLAQRDSSSDGRGTPGRRPRDAASMSAGTTAGATDSSTIDPVTVPGATRPGGAGDLYVIL